jgi:hypothetical protein
MTAEPVALDERARQWPATSARVRGRFLLLAVVFVALVAAGPAVATVADDPATPSLPAAMPDSAATVAPAVTIGGEVSDEASDETSDGVPDGSGDKPAAGAGNADPAAPNLWATGVNATGAVLMTPLFPGWGQLYADGGWRAALAFGAEMYFWSNLLSRDRQARRDLEFADTLPDGDLRRGFVANLAAEHKEQMRDFVWWSGGALLIIALDAYVGAHLFNFDEDAVPVPDRWEDVFGPVGSGPAVSAGSGPEVTVFQWRKGF